MELATIKNPDNIKRWRGCEKIVLFYTAGGNVNHENDFGRAVGNTL
jgi:hypothetical protein